MYHTKSRSDKRQWEHDTTVFIPISAIVWKHNYCVTECLMWLLQYMEIFKIKHFRFKFALATDSISMLGDENKATYVSSSTSIFVLIVHVWWIDAPLFLKFVRSHYITPTLQWRQNGHDSVSNHQPHDCFLNRLFRRISKKTSKLRVTGTGEFPAQMAINAENASIWWRHHGILRVYTNASVQ